jgi:N-acetylglutamate synthase-like GNAT family acetyltransferase
MIIRKINENDRSVINEYLTHHFSSQKLVSRGEIHDSSTLPGIIACSDDAPLGFILYHVDGEECQIIAAVSIVQEEGIGRILMREMQGIIRSAGCTRLWLITTNNNIAAQKFYKSLGFKLVKTHLDAITNSRFLKPEIPEKDSEGIPIKDELEYELWL